jgi:hypothetical protein
MMTVFAMDGKSPRPRRTRMYGPIRDEAQLNQIQFGTSATMTTQVNRKSII